MLPDRPKGFFATLPKISQSSSRGALTAVRTLRGYSLLFLVAPCLAAAPIFEDGFESDSLGPPWLTDTTQTGRVTIETQHGPATGQRHLVLDDRDNDAVYSVAEAILPLDLSRKRNVVISFKAKSLGNEADPPPVGMVPSGTRNFDAVTVSLDAGASWRTVRTLAGVGEAWQTISIGLDSLVGGPATYGPDVRLRFSFYDNSPAPLDGIAIDDLLVEADDDKRALFELPTGPFAEGGPVSTGYLVLNFVPESQLTLTLAAFGTGQVALPASVTVPAGETAVSFTFSTVDDNLVNLTRTATLIADGPGVTSTPAVLNILDDEKPVTRLVLPSQITEADNPTNNATVSMDLTAAVPVRFDLAAAPAGQISLPTSVTIQPGQSQARFTVRASDDARIDGNVPVTITAAAAGLEPATAVVTAVDNESRSLTLQGPDSLVEGASATASVRIAGTMTSALSVNLASPAGSGLSLPATVVIPAGQTVASFTIQSLENSLSEGDRTVSWSATVATFIEANRPVLIQDDDPASYGFEPLAELLAIDRSIQVIVTPYDIQGKKMTTAEEALTFVLELPDGSTRPATITTALQWNNGIGNGWISVPNVTATPLRLRAQDARGAVGRSTPFDGMRSLILGATDLVWDARRGRFYVSVGSDPFELAHHVVAVDPESLEITGRVPLGTVARCLALGSGGDVLYAALDVEGAVARIDPETMTLLEKFPVGRNSQDEVMYAEDLAGVPGHPQRVLVSRARSHPQLWHQGVAVYENGVALPPTTPVDQPGSNLLIDASSETSDIVFGRSIDASDNPIRKLRLKADGVEEIWARRPLEIGRGTAFRSAGGLFFMESGDVYDGELTHRLGRLEVPSYASGLVLPELDKSRVFLFERTGASDTTYARLGVYDSFGYRMIRRITLDPFEESASSLTRWGANGLAWRNWKAVVFVSSSQLVPDGDPADVAVSIQATPNPAASTDLVSYTIQATNHGPGLARDVRAQAFSNQGEEVFVATAEPGSILLGSSPLEARFGDLAPGATATMVIQTNPRWQGLRGCMARVSAASIDPIPANNEARQAVGQIMAQGPDSVTTRYAPGDSMIYDSRRKLLWFHHDSWLPWSGDEWIVSLDPATGRQGAPMVLPDIANPRTLALSEQGRYLYVALNRIAEVHRFDLDALPPTSVRIPLRGPTSQNPTPAHDLAPVSGDGTSFLFTNANESLVGVYDGAVPRPGWISSPWFEQLESTRVQGVAIGLSNFGGTRELSRLAVSPSGVSVAQSVPNVGEPGNDIVADGGWVLTSTGRLFDAATLDEIRAFPIQGRPCLDAARRQAFFVYGKEVRAYDATTGSVIGSMGLPVSRTDDWADDCVRWGLDGLAIRGDNFVHLVRWSQLIPANADDNSNGIPDRWEAANMGPFGGDLATDTDGDGLPAVLEYVFGTPEGHATPDPRQVTVTESGMLRLVFPRRAGLGPGWYAYQTTPSLEAWSAVTPVSETILSSQTVNGVELEMVEALLEPPAGGSAYVRLIAPPR